MKMIKKAGVLLLMLALLTGLLGGVTVFAAENEPTTAITIGSGTLTEGKVDLAVSITGNPGFGALQMTFTLPNGLSIESAEAGSMLNTTATEEKPVTDIVLQNGNTVAVISTEDCTQNGTLFTLHLTGSGTGDVTAKLDRFATASKNDETGVVTTTDLKATVVNGKVSPAEHVHTYGDNGFCSADDALNADAKSYTVSNAAQLGLVAARVNEGDDMKDKSVTLDSDISLASENWGGIGNKDYGFAGTFDGTNHTVSGLTITDCTGGYRGLFGNNSGTVKNVTVSGTIGTAEAKITSGGDNIGGVVGFNSGTVTGVTANVTVHVNTDSIYAVGGVVGQNGEKGTISNSMNTGAVEGTKCVGGIVGRNYGAVMACVNTANITGNSGNGKDGIGGIAGMGGNKKSTYTNTITSCVNSGTISNPNAKWVGGIVGMTDGATTVSNCYAVGTVSGSGLTNPIIGQNEGTANYNYCLDTTITNDDDGVYNAGGTKTGNKALTEAEMKAVAFVTTLNDGTSVENQWKENCSTYPALSWQNATLHTPGEKTNGKILCTVCNAVIEGCDHAWNDGEVTTAATCGAEGVKTYTCTKCSETKTEAIPATGEHTYVDHVCSVCKAAEPSISYVNGESTITIYETELKAFVNACEESTMTREGSNPGNGTKITAKFANVSALVEHFGGKAAACTYKLGDGAYGGCLIPVKEAYVYFDNNKLTTARDGQRGLYWYSGVKAITANNTHSYDDSGVCTVCGASKTVSRTIEKVGGDSNPAVYTLSEDGNTLNVRNDAACVVLYTTDGGETYTKLTAAKNETAGGYDFDLTGVPANAVIKIAVKGDIDGDGSVLNSDAIMILRSLQDPSNTAKYRKLQGLETVLADVDGDGSVLSSDAIEILRSLQDPTPGNSKYKALTW